MGLIYGFRNKMNNKWYVGLTTNTLDIRVKQHINSSVYKCMGDYNTPLHRAIRKYGIDIFEIVILEDNIPDELLNDREIYWVKEKNSFGCHGYNQTTGGKQRTSFSKESIELNRLHNLGNGKGRKLSDETKRKIREANLGKKLTEEHKAKLRKPHNVIPYNKGVYGVVKHGPLPQEVKDKIAAANRGKKRTMEQRQKISEAHKGITYTRVNPILVYDSNHLLIGEFKNSHEAARSLDLNPRSLSSIISCGKEQYKGYIFKKKNAS